MCNCKTDSVTGVEVLQLCMRIDPKCAVGPLLID